MEKTTYGLMHKATQHFIRSSGDGPGYSGRFSMHNGKLFQSDQLIDVINFLKAENDRNGYSHYRGDHDPEEFVPVRFSRTDTTTRKFEEAQILELPEIVKVDTVSTRSLRGTPRNLLRSYLPADVINVLDDMKAEFAVLKSRTGDAVEIDQVVYKDRYSETFGAVRHIQSLPDSWPMVSPSSDYEGYQLALIDRDNEAVVGLSRIVDIEPILAGPKI